MNHFDKFANATPDEDLQYSYREVLSLRDKTFRPLRSSPGYGAPWKTLTPIDKYYRATIAQAIYVGQPRSVWAGNVRHPFMSTTEYIYVLWRRTLRDKASARMPWPDWTMNTNKKDGAHLTEGDYRAIDRGEEQNWQFFNEWNEQLNFLYRVRFLTNNICRYHTNNGINLDALFEYSGEDFAQGKWASGGATIDFGALMDSLKMLGNSLPSFMKNGDVRNYKNIDQWEDIIRTFFEKTGLNQHPSLDFDFLSLAQPRQETAIKTYQLQNGEIKEVAELVLPLTISDMWYEGAKRQDNPGLMDLFHLDGYEGVGPGEKDLLVASLGCDGTKIFERNSNGTLTLTDSFGERESYTLYENGNAKSAAQDWEKFPADIRSTMNESDFVDQNLWETNVNGSTNKVGSTKKAKTAFLPTPPVKMIASKVRLHKDTGGTLRLLVPNLGHLSFTRLLLEVDHQNTKFKPPKESSSSNNKNANLGTLGAMMGIQLGGGGQSGFGGNPSAIIGPCGANTKGVYANFKSSWALGGCFSTYVVNYPDSFRSIRKPNNNVCGGKGFPFPKNWAMGYNARDLSYLYGQITPEINNTYKIPIDETFGTPGGLDVFDSSSGKLGRGFKFLDKVRERGIGGIAIFQINKTTGKFARSGSNITFTQNDRSNPDTRFSETVDPHWDDMEKPEVIQRSFSGKTNASYGYYKKPDNSAGNPYGRVPYNIAGGSLSAADRVEFLKELGANGPGAHPCTDLDIIENGGEIYIVTNGFNAPFYDFVLGKWIDKLTDPGKQLPRTPLGGNGSSVYTMDTYDFGKYLLYTNRNMLAEMALALKSGNQPSITPFDSDAKKGSPQLQYCGTNLRYVDFRYNDMDNPLDEHDKIANQKSRRRGTMPDPRPMYRFIYHDLAFNGSRFQTLQNPIQVNGQKGTQPTQGLARDILGASSTSLGAPGKMNWFSGGYIKEGLTLEPQTIGEVNLAGGSLQNQIKLTTSKFGTNWFGTFHFLVGIGINNVISGRTGDTWFPTLSSNSGTKSGNIKGVQINWFPQNEGSERNTEGPYDDIQLGGMGGGATIDNTIFGGAILHHGGIRVYQLDTTLDEMVFVKNKIGGSYPFYINETESGFRDNIADDGKDSSRAITYPPELMKNLFRLQGGDWKVPGDINPYDEDLVKAYKNQVGGGNHYGTMVKIYLDDAGKVQILSGNDRKSLRIMPYNTRDLMNTNFYGLCGAMAGYLENDKLNSMEFDITKSKTEATDDTGWMSCITENFGLPHMWQPFKHMYHRMTGHWNVGRGETILCLAAWHPVVFNTRGLFDMQQVNGEDILYQADGVFKKSPRGFQEIVSRMYYEVECKNNQELVVGGGGTSSTGGYFNQAFGSDKAMVTHVAGGGEETLRSFGNYGPVAKDESLFKVSAAGPVSMNSGSMRDCEYGYNVGMLAGGKVYSIKKAGKFLLVGFGSEYEPRLQYMKRLTEGEDGIASTYNVRYADDQSSADGSSRQPLSVEEMTLRLAVLTLYKGERPYSGSDHLSAGPDDPGNTKTIGGT